MADGDEMAGFPAVVLPAMVDTPSGDSMDEEAPDCRPAKRSRFSSETDLVVEVEGDEFRLHSVLLMLASRVFRRLLESGMRETQEGRIHLKGKSRQEFLEVLPFLTTVASTPRVTADTVPVLLHWADEYEIDAAKKACEEFLMTQEANSIEALSQAVDFNLQRRIRQCIKAISADIYVHWHELRPFAKNSQVMEVLWPAIFKAAKVQLPQEELSSSPSLEALWPLIGAAVERLSPMERPAAGLPVKVIENLELAKALCEATPGILHWPSEKDRVVGKWGTIRSVKNEVAVVQFGGGTAHTWSFPCSALLCRR